MIAQYTVLSTELIFTRFYELTFLLSTFSVSNNNEVSDHRGGRLVANVNNIQKKTLVIRTH